MVQEHCDIGGHPFIGITSSSTGAKLAAVADGYLYTSGDFGTTWTLPAAAGSRQFHSITSSDDGVHLAVGVS